jgi:hypothetical protein
MRVALERAKHFITCDGKFFGAKNEHAIQGLLISAENSETASQTDMFALLPENELVPKQKRLFSTRQNATLALTGEL